MVNVPSTAYWCVPKTSKPPPDAATICTLLLLLSIAPSPQSIVAVYCARIGRRRIVEVGDDVGERRVRRWHQQLRRPGQRVRHADRLRGTQAVVVRDRYGVRTRQVERRREAAQPPASGAGLGRTALGSLELNVTVGL